jgi:hypothetical protein
MFIKRTIQMLLCEIWLNNPYATNEEVSTRVKEEFGDKTNYTPARVQRDRRRYNTADFPCQGGFIPVIPAENPEGARFKSKGVDPAQLTLDLG